MRKMFAISLVAGLSLASCMPVAAAAGTKSNFIINNPFVYSGYTEMLAQFSDAFNEQSNGAIVLTSQSRRGELESSTFFQNISGLVTRRDTTSVASVTDTRVPMAQIDMVKVDRKVGPVAHTYDSFRKIGIVGNVPENHHSSGIDELDLVVGQQTAKATQVEQINTVLKALVTSLYKTTGLKWVNKGSSHTLDTIDLVETLAKMGDRAANNVGLWVMHSREFYKLVGTQITGNLDGVTGFVVASGSPVTLNRPVLVIDSPSLIITDGVSAGVNSYVTLGLCQGAAMAEDSEDMMLATQLISGNENLMVRIQGEYSYNVGVKGFTYNVAGGGVNPNDTAMGTAANWVQSYADVKDLGGVIAETA